MTFSASPFGSDSLSSAASASISAFKAYATGFCSTGFGTPVSPFRATASGFCSTAFGTPTGTQFFTAKNTVAYQHSAGVFTQFGTPISPLRYVATGFCSTRFGANSAITNRWSGYAVSIHSTAFGTPSGYALQHHTASGFCSTQFGASSAHQKAIAYASGFLTTRFGTPSGRRESFTYGPVRVLARRKTVSVLRSH